MSSNMHSAVMLIAAVVVALLIDSYVGVSSIL